MNLINRQKTAPAPVAPEPDVAPLQELARTLVLPADRHDEAERAADCLEQAEALRGQVEGTVEAAQSELAAIEAEAARNVTAARTKLRDVQAVAQSVERESAAVENKGRSYQSAANLARQAREVWDAAQTLAAERQDQLGTADALSARLSDLRALQKAAETDLEAAKAAVAVDAAGEAQQRLTGITAVMPTLTTQHAAAAGRARAIGTEEAGGEYAQALARVAALLKQRDQALDNAEPERIEARRAANPAGALLEDLASLPPAAREQVLASWSGGAQQQTASSQVQGSASGGRTAVVRRNG